MPDDLDTLTDGELMVRVKTADQLALRAIYSRHSAGLTAFVSQTLGGDVEAAADIVHETFIRVWEAPESFREDVSLRAWLYTIGRNKAIDRLRKNRREVLRDPDPAIPDLDPDPEQCAVIGEDKRRVRECLEKLSATHRNVVSLSFFEGLTYHEVGSIEGVSEGTVKSRIFHAKKLLMHCLSQ